MKGDLCFQFWDILLEMVLQNDHEIIKTACSLIAFLKINYGSGKTIGEKYDYDTIAMNKMAVDLFIEFNFESKPFETIKFLIDRYEFVSEFDTSAVENDVII